MTTKYIGDVNNNGEVNLDDAQYIINWLAAGGRPNNLAPINSNDNYTMVGKLALGNVKGSVDNNVTLDDAQYIINWVAAGGDMNNLGPINSNENVYTIKELILQASLSTERSTLAGTTAGSFAIFGFGDPINSTVDTYDGTAHLERVSLNYGGTHRSLLAATSVSNTNDSYALFGGGYGSGRSNEVDIFKCNDSGVFNDQPLQQFKGAPRDRLAATTVSNTNDSYALFGGGDGGVGRGEVDIFKCNDDGVFYYKHIYFKGVERFGLAATSVSNTNDSYALFGGGGVGGGDDGGFVFSNEVDIFKCNDDGVFNDEPLMQFKGARRIFLAATSVSYGNNSYALFGGGYGGGGRSNDVDIFKCNDDGVFNDQPLMHFQGLPRYNLAATTVSYENDTYALFGGGYDDTLLGVSNDVDIFICNDSGVFYHKHIYFEGLPRYNLAATSVKVDGIEYALFAGGTAAAAVAAGVDVIDIYNPVTGEFLPL